MFGDKGCAYMNGNYRLKLVNFLYKTLVSWFIPSNVKYISMKDLVLRDEMGREINVRKGTVVDVVFTSFSDKILKMERGDGGVLYIKNNDYFFFNYWFEPYDEKLKIVK